MNNESDVMTAIEIASGDPRVLQVLNHRLTIRKIINILENWEQCYEEREKSLDEFDPQARTVLLKYAADAARIVFDVQNTRLDFSPGWKHAVADHVSDLTANNDKLKEQQELMVEDESLNDFVQVSIGFKRNVMQYSTESLAIYAGSIAYMISNGFDPELLVLTEEEAFGEYMRILERMRKLPPNDLDDSYRAGGVMGVVLVNGDYPPPPKE